MLASLHLLEQMIEGGHLSFSSLPLTCDLMAAEVAAYLFDRVDPNHGGAMDCQNSSGSVPRSAL
jgi:hypothetical protein